MGIYAGELALDRQRLTRDAGYGLIDDSQWIAQVDFFIDQRLRGGTLAECPLEQLATLRYLIDTVTTTADSEDLGFSDDMHPFDYERLVADGLTKLGRIAQLTGGTGDQGIDIIATMNEKRVVLQCKRYASPVGNSAVQQVFAGRAFVLADAAVVVSSAGFTPSAVELAERTHVILLHHDQLAQLQLAVCGTTSSDTGPMPMRTEPRTSRSSAEEILRVTPTHYEKAVHEGLACLGWDTGCVQLEEFRSEVVAERDGIRVVVHCLGFISPVNGSYIESAISARRRTLADLAVIVSDQPITDDARELASICGVILLSHYSLAKLDQCVQADKVLKKHLLLNAKDFEGHGARDQEVTPVQQGAV